MDTATTAYELVRMIGLDDFRTVGLITDRDEAAFLLRHLNDRFRGRLYLLIPVRNPQRRAE